MATIFVNLANYFGHHSYFCFSLEVHCYILGNLNNFFWLIFLAVQCQFFFETLDAIWFFLSHDLLLPLSIIIFCMYHIISSCYIVLNKVMNFRYKYYKHIHIIRKLPEFFLKNLRILKTTQLQNVCVAFN